MAKVIPRESVYMTRRLPLQLEILLYSPKASNCSSIEFRIVSNGCNDIIFNVELNDKITLINLLALKSKEISTKSTL